MTISFGKYILPGLAGEYRDRQEIYTYAIENEIVTTSVDVDTAQNTIAVKSIGSVYFFTAGGQSSSIDHDYSYIRFFVKGATNSWFGFGPGPYDSGWYGNVDTKISGSQKGGGYSEFNVHAMETPVSVGKPIYATPIGYKDEKTSIFGIMWSSTPTFEQGADYLEVGYISTSSWDQGIKDFAAALMADAVDATMPPVLSIDHTAMIQGWIVGKRLAAMRGKKLPGDITNATFENGILYIKNASAVLNGSILEVK